MRKFDRAWVNSIHETEALIRNTPIGEVPYPHRPVVKRQFDAEVTSFRHELMNGFDTSRTQARLLELALLAVELIEDAEKAKAQFV